LCSRKEIFHHVPCIAHFRGKKSKCTLREEKIYFLANLALQMVKDDKNQRLTVRAASTQLSRKVTQMNYEHRQASQATLEAPATPTATSGQ